MRKEERLLLFVVTCVDREAAVQFVGDPTGRFGSRAHEPSAALVQTALSEGVSERKAKETRLSDCGENCSCLSRKRKSKRTRSRTTARSPSPAIASCWPTGARSCGLCCWACCAVAAPRLMRWRCPCRVFANSRLTAEQDGCERARCLAGLYLRRRAG